MIPIPNNEKILKKEVDKNETKKILIILSDSK